MCVRTRVFSEYVCVSVCVREREREREREIYISKRLWIVSKKRGITLYPHVVCSKFNLPTRGFIFDTLPICASLRYHSVTHLIFCRYSNKFLIKNTTHERSNTPISKKHTPTPTVLTRQWSRGYNASFLRDWTETQLGFDRATTSRKNKAESGFIFVK